MSNSKRWWSVKLRVENDELAVMSGLHAPTFAGGARHIKFGGSAGDEVDDPPSLTFELQAPDYAAAEESAQSFAYRMRRAAKLPDSVLPIVWLAPLAEGDASSRFLDEAEDLIDAGQYGLAVVAAQIHFEVQLRALLEEAAGANPHPWSVRLLKGRGGVELKREPLLAVIELLLDVDVTQLPEWQRFNAHLDRRNAVVHKGQAVELNQAKDSVAVVRELWIRLSTAARSSPDELRESPSE